MQGRQAVGYILMCNLNLQEQLWSEFKKRAGNDVEIIPTWTQSQICEYTLMIRGCGS